MNNQNKKLEAAIAPALNDRDLRLSEIPDLDLYIDQILTLVAGKNSSASERYRENVLTKTMINNYSKEGLLMPVKGKKYTREHIVQMLLIYSLKNTLSIGEIHRVLEGARAEGVEGDVLMKSYEALLEGKESAKLLAAESARQISGDSAESESGSDFFVSLLELLCYSAYIKNIALELLEARYPVPEERDKEKKPEKEKDKPKKDKEKEKDKAKRSVQPTEAPSEGDKSQ